MQVIDESAKVPQEHTETGSDDPGDAAGSEARRGTCEFQNVPWGAIMITNQSFSFISASNSGPKKRDLAKDPRIPENGHNDFPV